MSSNKSIVRVLPTILAFSFSVLLCAYTADAAILNQELVVNGGAEIGDVTGWVSDEVDAFPSGEFPGSLGDFVFRSLGGSGSSGQTLRQSIDVSDLSQDIDNGEIISSFSVQLQSLAGIGVRNTASVFLVFLDDSGLPIGV